jgi:tetratricopeptide (TPR) repeat protein
LKRFNEAIDALNRAKRIAQPPLEVFLLLTELYLEKEMPEKARDTLVEASRVDKTNPLIPYYQGLIELRLGALHIAKKRFKWSLELNPELLDSKFQLAFITSRENPKDSYLLAQEILDQDKEYYPARQLAAKLAFGLRDFQNVVDILELSIIEDPLKWSDNIEILLKSWIEMDESEAAIAFIKHLFDINEIIRDRLESNPFIMGFLRDNDL